MGNYDAAAKYFGRAASMAPAFSFAAANRCVALFAAGRTNESMREMRAVLRRYPDFPDTRAALTAALWSIGKEAEAESNWCARCFLPRVWPRARRGCRRHACARRLAGVGGGDVFAKGAGGSGECPA